MTPGLPTGTDAIKTKNLYKPSETMTTSTNLHQDWNLPQDCLSTPFPRPGPHCLLPARMHQVSIPLLTCLKVTTLTIILTYLYALGFSAQCVSGPNYYSPNYV
jgi:hypothetical protein